jgi:HEAT repeat protein
MRNCIRDKIRISTLCRLSIFLVLATCLLAASEQSSNAPSSSPNSNASEEHPVRSAKPAEALHAERAQRRAKRAWQMLESACTGDNQRRRSRAIRVLGLMRDDPRALPIAERSLRDEKAQVRTAAAAALADLRAPSSIPALHAALEEEEDPEVILAVAHALTQLEDAEGFQVYYEILTGQRKAKKGMLARQTAMLTDPRKLAHLGFVQGLGFAPYAGIGWAAFQEFKKGDLTPFRAAAARVLAKDPDPDATQALVEAAGDNRWLVRAAALEALAARGDTSTADNAAAHLGDDSQIVRFTAAAAFLELTALQRSPHTPPEE